MSVENKTRVVIVGGGFTGLAAAYELAQGGVPVTVLEAESEVGGLASSFDVGGEQLERFYHHWFISDVDALQLIEELNLSDRLEVNRSHTGVYYANNFFKLSTPWDVLNFTPLSIVDRIRLGLLAVRVRRIKDWKTLEGRSAQEWLRELCGENVCRVVWQPLLEGKFGPYANQVSAVWFWNKLKLRGGSRGKGGEERLAYLRGGFAVLAERLAQRVRELGGQIELNSKVSRIHPKDGAWLTTTTEAVIKSDHVVATTALPLVADMVRGWASDEYVKSLERIRYLGNVCLVLELDRSLSNTYWLNVNDPSFPFVGVIEHTNFVRSGSYGGRHIVYLSKYLSHSDPLFSMESDELLDYALPYLRKMFPKMKRDWVMRHRLWKARWSQPLVEKHYGRLIPPKQGPLKGLHICSMAQIYPEDRGTNYAIREGRQLGKHLCSEIPLPFK